MTTTRWRGDAPTRPKILRLLEPTITTGVSVTVSVGNKTQTFAGWNSAAIATALTSRNFPELTGVVITTSGGDVVLTGPADTDFDVALSVTPAVEVSDFTNGSAVVSQITRLAFNGATGGTFTLTCNGQTTAAISLKTSGTLNTAGIVTAIDALAAFVPTDVVATVDGADVVLAWANNFAAKPVAVTMNATELNNGGTIDVSEVQAASPATHDIYMMATDADFEFDLANGNTGTMVLNKTTDGAVVASVQSFVMPETQTMFWLRYAEEDTALINYTDNQATVEAALESLAGMQNVAVTIDAQDTYTAYSVSFESVVAAETLLVLARIIPVNPGPVSSETSGKGREYGDW